jgi:hypothetical protein
MRERIERMVSRMKRSPVMCAESYPDECWIFCNTVALAATRMGDVLDGTDHSSFLSDWVLTARERLVDPGTGMLISAFGVDGRPAACAPGPEGSSIWMAAHILQIVDGELARDQYRRARRELGRTVLGFGYAMEWPESRKGLADIDSGPVIPVAEASAGSSGLAIMGAAAFGDRDFLQDLLTSLSFAGFPDETDDQLRYCASNPVGDSVILYAMLQGPLWADILGRVEMAP